MVVFHNDKYWVVKSVFKDELIGPFDNREDAERWLSCYRHANVLIGKGVME